MNKIKKTVLEGLLEIINEISNSNFQYKVWIKGEGPESSSFDEALCGFFDDYCAEEIIKNYSEYNISHKQKRILKKFSDNLRKYSNEHLHIHDIDIMQDSKWRKIQKMAKEVLKAFNYQEKK